MGAANKEMESNADRPGRYLGIVVQGSVGKGVGVRLDSSACVEEVKLGTFVTLHGEKNRFFGIVKEIGLGSTDPRLPSAPPDVSNTFVAQVVSHAAAFGTIEVLPQLVLPLIGGIDGEVAPAKTVPAHFARAHASSEAEVALVFGEEDSRHFYIGTPLDMETKVCLQVEELVKRSNGVFGKSGTGKTFLTRLLLAGMLQKSEAVTLVFDMHSEYGWAGYNENGTQVKGLKQLFPARVAVFTLDLESSRRRGASADSVVSIGYDEVEPEDVKALQETLNLSDVAADAAYAVERYHGQKRWLKEFLKASGDEFSQMSRDLNVQEGALSSLQRRLRRLERLAFLTEETDNNAVPRILEYLERGYHVVLEFGRYGDDLTAYILMANLLTRRIHTRYRVRKEAALGDRSQEPRPLVIVIEEAHKFLSPHVASQTIFGTIARELRKYNVTLLVIDQRPSAIDPEVMSQVGTKIVCLLDNERDVEAVLTGVSGARELRGVLARMEPKQQALIFGHSVPLPVVVQVRDYGTELSYSELARGRHPKPVADSTSDHDPDMDELFG